ncbi:MAG: hypothetical protein J6D21_07445 [Clostridia bacterium]|nr:hypothetical protein [Clostridia bacterium]
METMLKKYLEEEADPTSKYGIKKWGLTFEMPGSPENRAIAEKAEAASGYAKPALDRYKIKQDSINTRYAGVTAPGAQEEYVRPAEDRYNAKLEGIGTRYDTAAEKEREQYRAAVREQRAARSAAKREAYIAHERLQKYLPQARAVQGIEGMGMTETAKLQGLNAYLGNRSAADAAYAAGVRELDTQLLKNQSERELSRAQEEAAAKDTYLKESDSLLREYRQKVEDKAREEADAALAYQAEREALLREYREKEEREAATRSEAVTDALAAQAEQMFLSSADGKISQEDYNTLEAYVNANQEKLSPLEAELIRDITLEGYRKQIRSEAEQEAFDRGAFTVKNATFADISKFEDNKNLTVKVGGNSYRVQLNAPGDAPVSDATVTAAARQAREGDVFGLGGNLYLKHNGEVYGIEERSNSAKGEYTALYDLFFGDGSNGGASQNQVQTLSAYQNTYATGNTIAAPDTNGTTQTVRITKEATGIENAGVKVDTLKPGVIYYVRGSKIIKGDDGRVYFVN